MPSAGVVIIGNEILSGKFADENGPFLVGRLRALGVDLRRITVVPDEIDVIADEVRASSARFDHVFTTGGVGPTHDDLTLEAIAAAFDVPLELREELAVLLDRFGMERTPANLRMVTLPAGAELLSGELSVFPVVRVRNVFVFPGVPRLVRQKFEDIAALIASDAVRCVRVYARDHETDIAQQLTELHAAHPGVEIGSYPRWGEPEARLIITLEARDEVALGRARDAVVALLDVVRVDG